MRRYELWSSPLGIYQRLTAELPDAFGRYLSDAYQTAAIRALTGLDAWRKHRPFAARY